MSRQTVYSKEAPKPIGPYSQAICYDRLVFTSGQIPIDARTGELAGSDVGDQTKQVLENLSFVLKAAESSLDAVIKTTIYLKNMNDFTRVNQVYASYFGQSPPARSTVEVSRLPKDVLVEIDCIAVREK